MKITVSKYNTEWTNQFNEIKKILSTTLSDFNPIIEHFGSTAISGLSAKPIIDVLIGISSKEDLDKVVKVMLPQKYIYYQAYNSAMPERRLFVQLKNTEDYTLFEQTFNTEKDIPHEALNNLKLAHIHIWEYQSSEWNRHIAFRDYIRTHPEVKDKYGELKKKLSQADWKDGNEYNDAKNDFIKREETKAITWFKNLNSIK